MKEEHGIQDSQLRDESLKIKKNGSRSTPTQPVNPSRGDTSIKALPK